MANRVKYPLTPEAKEAAKALVQAWDEGKLEQDFLLIPYRDDASRKNLTYYSIGDNSCQLAELLELSYFGLLQIRERVEYDGVGKSRIRRNVLLLQEIRNTVANSFEVSDYFLTLNAVGTIVYGNLEVKDGAIFQSGASNQGDVNQQSMIQLANDIEDKVGDLALRDEALKVALAALKASDNDDKETRKSKMEAVALQLARVMGYVSDTGGVIGAIGLLAKIMGVL